MRADRLVALVLFLQQRKRVTAAEAAAELEVSERTARRDLEALSAAGIPVYSERGRGGGWRLLGDARTDLSGLNAAEARALFLVAGPAADATPALKAALRKLVRALPEPLRNRAEASASAVVIDPQGWGEARRARRPPHLDALHAAVVEGEQVRLEYTDRSGRTTTRPVHPLGVASKRDAWYLIAGTAGGLRTFRISRVTGVERTGEPSVRPPNFDLAETWRAVVDRVDELRTPVQVTVHARPELVELLQWMFDRQATVHGQLSGGLVAVTIRGPSLDMLLTQLAGFGQRVEVVAPPEARVRLRELADELVQVYTPAH